MKKNKTIEKLTKENLRYKRALYFLKMKLLYARSDEKESLPNKDIDEVLEMAKINKTANIVFYDNCDEVAYKLDK